MSLIFLALVAVLVDAIARRHDDAGGLVTVAPELELDHDPATWFAAGEIAAAEVALAVGPGTDVLVEFYADAELVTDDALDALAAAAGGLPVSMGPVGGGLVVIELGTI